MKHKEYDNIETACEKGLKFFYGKGVGQNFEQAKILFEISLNEGEIIAYYYLGLCHRYGLGCDVNHKKAFIFLKYAADEGIPEAKYQAACCYENGEGVENNEDMVWQLLEEAANEDVPDAQYALGEKYIALKPPDYDSAEKYWAMAANNGLAIAQLKLGLLYKDGIGVEKNEKLAIRLFKLAADQDLPEEQYQLALMYEKKNGMFFNKQRQIVDLLKKASEAGHEGAGEALSRHSDNVNSR